MFAVIFRADIKKLDEQYALTAERMRKLATERYGCIEFTACTEGNQEIAVSYWASREHIKAWKSDPEHKAAQAMGRRKWYRSYRVQIVEILKDYSGGEDHT